MKSKIHEFRKNNLFMPKHLFLTLIMALFLNTLQAYTLKQKEVPTLVKEAFQRAHPSVNYTSWTRQENNYKVEYAINRVDIANTYEASGKLVNVEADIEINMLPAVIGPYVKANYNNSSINQAFKIKDNNGTITYRADLNNKSLFFNAAGSFVSESKK